MINSIKSYIKSIFKLSPFIVSLYTVVLLIAIISIPLKCFDIALACAIYSIIILAVYCFRPKSVANHILVDDCKLTQKIITIVVALITIAALTLPMSINPLYNGEQPHHRNQYEIMAESILSGHIDMYPDEDKSALEKLENPYDPQQRTAANAYFHWDHAYYNSHYYMYFGIVPVFLLFLPFRLITGTSLLTYHAVQIFVALSIIGFFVLFYTLSKTFFKKMSFGMYIALSVGFSAMSFWYAVGVPTLYTVPITSGICLMIWSIYFFIKAVYIEKTENRQIIFAFFGALLGALAFGCRPPIALANIIIIPMLIVFLKQRKFTLKLLLKLIYAASPYFIIAILLMVYNYVRFESPFEFGQSYQLTVADQTVYTSILDSFNLKNQINGLVNNFIKYNDVSDKFPYIAHNGAFINFPILLLCFAAFKPAVYKKLKENKLNYLVITMFITLVLITAIDVLWSPYILERYRMDIYFIMAILCFIVIGFFHSTIKAENQNKFSCFIMIFSLFTFITSIVLFLIPADANYTLLHPEILENIKNFLFLK